MEKLVIVSDDYHDIGQLLLLTIIDSKNWTNCQRKIMAIIMQNWLIAHP